MTDFEVSETGTHKALSEKDLEISNLRALLRESVELITDLMPAFGNTTVDVGKLNRFLINSKEYT